MSRNNDFLFCAPVQSHRRPARVVPWFLTGAGQIAQAPLTCTRAQDLPGGAAAASKGGGGGGQRSFQWQSGGGGVTSRAQKGTEALAGQVGEGEEETAADTLTQGRLNSL